MIVDKLQHIINKLSFNTFLQVWSDVLNENKQFIEDAQRYQLGRGELPDGSDTDDYTYVSVAFFEKPTESNPYLQDSSSQKITGYDTGSLYKDIYAEISPLEIAHKADNPNKEKLEDRIGEFLGINAESAKIILEEFREEYKKRLRNEIMP